MIRKTACASVLLISSLGAQTSPNAMPKGVERVSSVEGITEYKLSNGLKVLLFPDPTKEAITVNITYLVGSRHEDYGETGMAHLLEHLVFKGTPKHPNIPQELTAHGARPNGSTWFDRTNYFETFAATEENLRWALDLEADRMVNSFIAKKDLDSEMTVVRNEFEMGENDPMSILSERVAATAFLWHNYGKSTIGSKADLENVPIDRLQGFYKKHYQPDNAVLTVAGKIDEPKALALVSEYFSKIPKPERTIQNTYTLDPVQDGERTVTVNRVGEVQGIEVAYHTPDGAHPDHAPLEVLLMIMRHPPSGRLYKALVETKKAAAVGGYNFQLKEPGLLGFSARLRKENDLNEAREILLKTVHDVAATPPTQEEVDRAKNEILKNFDLAVNNSTRIGMELSEPASAGDWRLLFLTRDRVRAVTPADVLRVAKAYLKVSNRTVGVFVPTEAPDRSEIPPLTDLTSALKDYKGGEKVAQGEAFDPSIENVRKRTIYGRLGDGMKLVFVPKKTRGNTVHADVALHFGDVNSLKGQTAAASLTPSMLMRGTQKRTRTQIQDELSKLKARVIPMPMGASAMRFRVETTRPNLPAVMKLVNEMLREPAFQEAEFDQLKRANLAQLDEMRSDPQALAMIGMQQHLAPFTQDDPRAVRSPDDQIADMQKLTVDDVKNFYQNFYGTSRSELTVVGDFDAEQMQAMSRDFFAAWKSPKPFSRLMYPMAEVATINRSIETPDKANATFIAGQLLKLGDEHPDYPALLLGNYLLGGGFLNSRIAARIRQKDGLSYGAGSMLNARPKDETGMFMAYAIAAPQNVAKVETAFKEEVERALKDGFTEQEIAEGKKGWLQGRDVSRANDSELMMLLSGNAFLDRSLDYNEELEKKVAALTAEQIATALRRHIDPAKMSYIKAGDFKKAAATP